MGDSHRTLGGNRTISKAMQGYQHNIFFLRNDNVQCMVNAMYEIKTSMIWIMVHSIQIIFVSSHIERQVLSLSVWILIVPLVTLLVRRNKNCEHLISIEITTKTDWTMWTIHVSFIVQNNLNHGDYPITAEVCGSRFWFARAAQHINNISTYQQKINHVNQS